MRPELVVLLLTTRCNLFCRYCYLSCGEVGEDMPFEVFQAVLARLETPPREVVLSGGEPVLVPDLLCRIVRALRERFARVRISLQTNGTLLEARLLEFLRHYGVGIGVSLDGPLEVNETLRGGTRDVVKGLRLLASLGVRCGVTITVTGTNAHRLGEAVLFLGQFPAVASFGLDILRPVGRAHEEDLPSAADLKHGLLGVQKAISWLEIHGRQLHWREATRRVNGRGYCPAERGTAMVVTPRGEVYPCASLVGYREFYMGNVLDGGLVRVALPRPCEGCGRDENGCPGRCPSRALVSRQAAALDCLVRESLGVVML